MMLSCLILTVLLTGCGASTPDLRTKDNTPDGFYEGAKTLELTQLVALAAQNPMFDITDERGLHFGTVALSGGRQITQRLPLCQTAIPGPMAQCIPKGAKVVNGRLSVGVAEFGGETGLYFIDQEAICFRRMTNLEGCHRLAVRYDQTIEVRTSLGQNHFWIQSGA